LINEAAASGEWGNVDEMTFANAGVTGVTELNLAAVKAELDGKAQWTVPKIQDIVDTIINENQKQTALHLINTAAASRDWNGVDASTFTAAGVTGVTASNLADITVALNENGSTPRSVGQIQGVIDSITALAWINNYYAHGTVDEPDVTTFANAGVTGVTELNVEVVITKLSLLTSHPWTVETLQAEINRILEIPKLDPDSPLGRIDAAAQSNDWTGITIGTFDDIGVTGVTADNLDLVFDTLHASRNETLTVEAIQSAVDFTNQRIALDLFNSAASSKDWEDITLETFETFGATGVTASNLEAIIAELKLFDSDSLPWTITTMQETIDAALEILPYLEQIDIASQSGDWSDITLETFENAGMINVTEENLIGIMTALEYGYLWYYSSGDLQRAIDVIISAIEVALSEINEAAQSGNWEWISEDQLSMMGVREVNGSNVEQIITALQSHEQRVWTVAELQVEINGILEDLG